MKTPDQTIESPEFRELQPIDHWSASLSLNALTDDDFDKHMKDAVIETGQNFLGFLITEEHLYIRTRYPRKKYGVPSVEECRTGTAVLARKLGVEAREQIITGEPRFRVIIGLAEGYDKKNKIHSFEEVVNELGQGFKVRRGEVYSAGFLGNDKYGVYREPAVIIEGDKPEIRRVYTLAEKFYQERFTVEDLETSKSYIVETKFCKNPDLE
jgi:hypothetical protein